LSRQVTREGREKTGRAKVGPEAASHLFVAARKVKKANRRVKRWEAIADKLSKAGWSWGYVSVLDSEGERLGLLMLTAIMAKGLSFGQMKSCPRFLNLRGSRTN
jgi:hypothetical protein